ncbi:MAG: putative DNA-binding domain-containing protein [Zoogloeaceae bacterium]|nr:putative DNA-binding domain-containing protein [Zoogloeaceae bacterium]
MSVATFAAALLNPAAPCPSGLVTWNGSDAAQRFGVYRNNVTVSLIEALADSFPIVQQLVGDAFFRAMAGEFARQSPPTSPVLAWYGDAFADFVAAFPPVAGVPYLADVARLEYARVLAFHAADADPVPVAEIAACLNDADALPALRLQLHPSLQVIDSPFAITSLWGAHQGSGDLADIDPAQPECALVLRHGLSVEVMAVPAAAGRFIDALQAGASLGDAVQQASDGDTHFDPTPVLGLLISRELLIGLGRKNQQQGEKS